MEAIRASVCCTPQGADHVVALIQACLLGLEQMQKLLLATDEVEQGFKLNFVRVAERMRLGMSQYVLPSGKGARSIEVLRTEERGQLRHVLCAHLLVLADCLSQSK